MTMSRLPRLALAALLLGAAGVPVRASELFRDPLTGGSLSAAWEQHTGASAHITAVADCVELSGPMNAHALIARKLDRDCITASARILASRPPGISWCTSLFLYWDPGNWIQLGLVEEADGGHFYATEMVDGVACETRLAPCDLAKWQWVRIELGRDCVRYVGGGDGVQWQRLRTVQRPETFAGAPAYLAVGKGYSTGQEPYPEPLLSNDYTDLGPVVTSRLADVACAETPREALRLTAAEQDELASLGLDPVGRLEPAGDADPTFDSVARHFPPMLYPREAVGVPEHPDDVGVDFLGRLQLGNDTSAPDLPTFGFAVAPDSGPLGRLPGGLNRRLLDGWKPVVILEAAQEGVRWEQTVFGFSQGFSPARPLQCYVRLRCHGKGLPGEVSAVADPGGISRTWALHDVGPGAREVCLAIPFGKPGEAQEVTSEGFERLLAEVGAFWDREVAAQSTRIETPEQRVNDAYRAWLAYSLLDVDKVGGRYEPRDGAGFYEAVFGYSALLYCRALDRMGQHRRAARYLQSILQRQSADGLYTENFGLPDQGALMLAIAEHHALTGDKAWLSEIAPRLELAADWVVRARADAPEEGVAKGLIKFRPYCDFGEPVFGYFGDTYCAVGLQAAAEAFGALGMEDQAQRFGAEAAAYCRDILASMQAAAFEDRGMTLLPMEPETRRLLHSTQNGGGDYYGLVASCLLETGFLPVNGPQARLVTELLERRDGLLGGLCRFGPGGVDHAYTYGYLMEQLRRGQARRYLLGFYAMLAVGMTRDTYSGVECTGAVSGANAATLPHLYSCTQQLETLRAMLIREEGDALVICDAVPRAWLQDGRRITVRRAPTRFGVVSYEVRSHIATGTIGVRVRMPAHDGFRLQVRLRHPDRATVESVTTRGLSGATVCGEVITLPCRGGRVELTARYALTASQRTEIARAAGR